MVRLNEVALCSLRRWHHHRLAESWVRVRSTTIAIHIRAWAARPLGLLVSDGTVK